MNNIDVQTQMYNLLPRTTRHVGEVRRMSLQEPQTATVVRKYDSKLRHLVYFVLQSGISEPKSETRTSPTFSSVRQFVVRVFLRRENTRQDDACCCSSHAEQPQNE